MTTHRQKEDILTTAGFTALTPLIHVLTPPQTSKPSHSDPQVILLCVWLDAAPKHMLKYITQHRQFFPATPILLLQNNASNMLWRTDAALQQSLQPAVQFALSVLSNPTPDRPSTGVLIHAFSNGGCHSLVHFAWSFEAYLSSLNTDSSTTITTNAKPTKSTDPHPTQHHANRSSNQLPITTLILDSAPSQMHYLRSIHAVRSAIPHRTFLQKIPYYLLHTPLIALLIGMFYIFHLLGVREISVAQARRALNDPEGAFVRRGEVREGVGKAEGKGVGVGVVGGPKKRVYFFSKSDDMVWWEDVLGHAEEVRTVIGENEVGVDGKNGKRQVRVEVVEFQGTKHVAHANGAGAERYWAVVKGAWDQATQETAR